MVKVTKMYQNVEANSVCTRDHQEGAHSVLQTCSWNCGRGEVSAVLTMALDNVNQVTRINKWNVSLCPAQCSASVYKKRMGGGELNITHFSPVSLNYSFCSFKEMLIADRLLQLTDAQNKMVKKFLILVILNTRTYTNMVCLSDIPSSLYRCEAQDKSYCQSQEEKIQNKIFISATSSHSG